MLGRAAAPSGRIRFRCAATQCCASLSSTRGPTVEAAVANACCDAMTSAKSLAAPPPLRPEPPLTPEAAAASSAASNVRRRGLAHLAVAVAAAEAAVEPSPVGSGVPRCSVARAVVLEAVAAAAAAAVAVAVVAVVVAAAVEPSSKQMRWQQGYC